MRGAIRVGRVAPSLLRVGLVRRERRRARGGIGVAGALALALAWLVTGCAAPPVGPTNYPSDFAMVVTVMPGRYAGSNDPTRTPAQYIVESDRTLRVALGLGVRHDVHPPTTAVLSPREMTRLHEQVASHELMQAKTQMPGGAADPRDSDAPAARYHVELTADGETHRYRATPDASPGTAELVRTLASLYRRGG